MTTIAVAALIAVQSAASILETGLELARAIGLPVTSWRTGDPTRSLYVYLANVLAAREEVSSEFIAAGFLSTATGDWLKVLADEVYGVEAIEATFAAPTVTVKNNGGGFYVFDPGDLTVKASAIDKTYHNTNACEGLGAGDEFTFELTADEAGSDSTVAADEIDELVTTALGVDILSSTAAIGLDDESDDAIKIRCLASRGALSPNGPGDAYEYVVLNPDLTGVTDITRAKSIDDSDTGDVTVYVAGTSGAVAGASITAAQSAVEQWATPLCITPTVVNSTPVAFDIAADVSGEDIPVDANDLIEAAAIVMFATIPLGSSDDTAGVVARSAIYTMIHTKLLTAGATNVVVVLTDPTVDTTLTAGQVATTGTVAITEV